MRALVHIGLATLLVIAPALCCCNLHYLTGSRAVASVVHIPACPTIPKPATCCQLEATPLPTATCCDQPATPVSKPSPKLPQHCPACERPDTAPPQDAPEISAPVPTGELLPVTLLLQTAIPFEHLSLIGGLDPPERAGVDTLYEALFSRHVMRC